MIFMTVDTETNAAPALRGIFESAIYVDDLATAEKFYGSVLGLPKIFSVPGRQLVYRCQESILLVFNPTQTERDRVVINDGAIPLHGTRGAGHVAFRVERKDLDVWRQYFLRNEVPIESEVNWPDGAQSIYFRDPAGNSLELATPDMWKSMETNSPS